MIRAKAAWKRLCATPLVGNFPESPHGNLRFQPDEFVTCGEVLGRGKSSPGGKHLLRQQLGVFGDPSGPAKRSQGWSP